MKKITPRSEKRDSSFSNNAGTVGSSLMKEGSKRDAAHQASPENYGRPGHAQQSKTLKPTADGAQATLRLRNPIARKVFVAGNFNHWRGDATPLQKAEEGEWILSLALRPGIYEYRFVVDGQWCDDPLAKERVKNPYGGWNAVLKVSPRVIRLPDHLPQ